MIIQDSDFYFDDHFGLHIGNGLDHVVTKRIIGRPTRRIN